MRLEADFEVVKLFDDFERTDAAPIKHPASCPDRYGRFPAVFDPHPAVLRVAFFARLFLISATALRSAVSIRCSASTDARIALPVAGGISITALALAGYP